MAFPKIGNLAPAFSLPDQDGNQVSLKQFRDQKNVVLYFYPKAMTPGCTVQACGIRDSRQALAKLDTVVLGVSPDPVARLGKFIDKHDLNFTLLSDEDHAVAEKYGVWGLKNGQGVHGHPADQLHHRQGRAPTGKVATKSHHDDVLALIKELKL